MGGDWAQTVGDGWVAPVLGGGVLGVIVTALVAVWGKWRAEGVKHSPGEQVFATLMGEMKELRAERVQDRELIGTQARQIATLGEQVQDLRRAGEAKEIQISELRLQLHREEMRNGELEIQLSEANDRISKLREQIEDMRGLNARAGEALLGQTGRQTGTEK